MHQQVFQSNHHRTSVAFVKSTGQTTKTLMELIMLMLEQHKKGQDHIKNAKEACTLYCED